MHPPLKRKGVVYFIKYHHPYSLFRIACASSFSFISSEGFLAYPLLNKGYLRLSFWLILLIKFMASCTGLGQSSCDSDELCNGTTCINNPLVAAAGIGIAIIIIIILIPVLIIVGIIICCCCCCSMAAKERRRNKKRKHSSSDSHKRSKNVQMGQNQMQGQQPMGG